MSYLIRPTIRPTQREQARSDQVKNTAGGYVFQIDKWDQFLRFLIIGTEGGTYYASQRKLTLENVGVAIDCIREDGLRAIAIAHAVSIAGRAPKNDQVLYVFALAFKYGNKEAKKEAAIRLPEVARIGTHLLNFVAYADAIGGWGRTLRRAVASWYTSKDADKLAFQMTKYQSRDGWSHMDVLRSAHPRPSTNQHQLLFKWAVGKAKSGDERGIPKIVIGLELAKKANDAIELVSLIQEYGLTHEMIPTEHKNKPQVQSALLEKMPITALIRNLGNLSKSGLVEPGKFEQIQRVLEKITEKAIVKGRVHPLNILVAMKTYASGRGFRGSGNWRPVPQIVDKLNEAFYWSFKGLQPTNARHYVGVDVSGSMSSAIMGTNLSACEAAAAMAMSRFRVEPNCVVFGFSSAGDRPRYSYGDTQMVDLGIRPNDNLETVAEKARDSNFGRTDCAQPMLDAANRGLAIDVFEIYTDNETWVDWIQYC
jgi:60 kDa SS-A/Ro ribonucleoprotein